MGGWEGGACAEAMVALAGDGDGSQGVAILLSAGDCSQGFHSGEGGVGLVGSDQRPEATGGAKAFMCAWCYAPT